MRDLVPGVVVVRRDQALPEAHANEKIYRLKSFNCLNNLIGFVKMAACAKLAEKSTFASLGSGDGCRKGATGRVTFRKRRIDRLR
jgi:hypothetical protein